MITRVNMIILGQHNLDVAIQFYETLGLRKVFSIPDRWAEFELGSIKIGLCPAKEEQGDLRTGVVLEVDDLSVFYEKYKDQFDFQGLLIEKAHGKMISIKDPGNNIIDLYQPTPEKLKDLIKKVKENDNQEQACTKADACCKNKPQT